MARLTSQKWQQARRKWEADPVATFESVAEQYKISRQAVSKRAKAEGWAKVGALRQVAERAQLKADAKVAQGATKVARATGKKDAHATLDASVEIRAEVIGRHRQDWDQHRKTFAVAALGKDFEAGKRAKISAEMLLIRQRGERAAYGLEEGGGGGGPQTPDLAKTLGELIERLPG